MKPKSPTICNHATDEFAKLTTKRCQQGFQNSVHTKLQIFSHLGNTSHLYTGRVTNDAQSNFLPPATVLPIALVGSMQERFEAIAKVIRVP